jgi:hypothetical protein
MLIGTSSALRDFGDQLSAAERWRHVKPCVAWLDAHAVRLGRVRAAVEHHQVEGIR